MNIIRIQSARHRGDPLATETAKIVRFHKIGSPEVLQLDELPLHEPSKGEVRLRIKAIGLNRAEMHFSPRSISSSSRTPIEDWL